MPTPPPPRRPSTLHTSAQMMGVGRSSSAPHGAVPSRLVSSRPASLPMRTRVPQATPYATAVRGAARPAVDPAPAPSAAAVAQGQAAITRRLQRERSEQLIVSSVVIALLVTLGVMGAMQVTGDMSKAQSRTALTGTFGQVFKEQGTFRLLNNRFATWPELAARGAKLAPKQRVLVSNASASHWFLSLRDTSTGVTCSRTGELFDENPNARPPTCTNP